MYLPRGEGPGKEGGQDVSGEREEAGLTGRIQSLLNCMEDELAALLAPDPRARQQPSGTSRAQRAEDSASHSALHNPLGVLATAATQPSGLLMHGGQSGLYWNSRCRYPFRNT